MPKSSHEISQAHGADTLRSLKSDLHQDEIVKSSARHHERKYGEKTGNAERKIGAYLTRLEALAEDENTKERLIEHISNELVIQPEDIPESYWRQQEQVARDNGRSVELNDYLKDQLTEQLQDAQRTGLESWISYLDQTGDQYPTWFKVYALEGMSNLGTFNKKKGAYNKRSKGTVAPYPQLNPNALARTYDVVSQVHDQGGTLDNETLERTVRGGNFNKIYSHQLLDQKAIIPTPERPEDVHGEWTRYTENDVEAITHAAEGTPWCIAGENIARDYTKNGGEFYLFHLEDPETGNVSPTAAASIRMEGGRVAEISGLKGERNQYVEDVLVPEVMEKTKSLPGGERYIQAFEDKQALIAMDKKFQAGEPFSMDELRFLYECDRKIAYLDAYRTDSRPYEFRQHLPEHITQLAQAGAPVDELVSQLRLEYIVDSLPQLLEVGVAIDELVSRLRPQNIAYNLPQLLEAGADIDIDELVSQLDPYDIAYNVSQLLEAGVAIDELVSQLDPQNIAYNVSQLLEAGADIDIDELVSQLRPEYIVDSLPQLLDIVGDIERP